MHSDYLVFVDESGDHSLATIDEVYPVFVLSLCVIRKETYVSELTPRIRRLKIDTFGHDMVVLHEHDMRKKKGDFSRLGKEARESFLDELTRIVEQTEFTLFAIVIDKKAHRDKYQAPRHPYHMAMQFGLERVANFLEAHRQAERLTHLICEARGAKEDRDLELEFRRVCDGANYKKTKLHFDIVLADKRVNCEGLQFADLMARPVGLSVLRPTQANRAMDVLESKFAKNARGDKEGVGLKVFP